MTVEEAQHVLANSDLTRRERQAIETINRECAAVAFEAGRLCERTERAMTNAQLQAAILSGIDTVTSLPGFRMFATQQQRDILAGQKVFWGQPGPVTDANLTTLAGFVPVSREADAKSAVVPKTFNPVALWPAVVATAMELPAIEAEGGKVWAILGPVFTPTFDITKLWPAVQALGTEWPAIFAEGGKLVTIWLPVFGTPA